MSFLYYFWFEIASSSLLAKSSALRALSLSTWETTFDSTLCNVIKSNIQSYTVAQNSFIVYSLVRAHASSFSHYLSFISSLAFAQLFLSKTLRPIIYCCKKMKLRNKSGLCPYYSLEYLLLLSPYPRCAIKVDFSESLWF